MKIETFIKDFILSSYSNIFTVDIVNDIIYEFKYQNEELKYTSRKRYSEYLSTLNTFVHNEDIPNFVESLTISNLAKNNNRLKYTYRRKLGNDNYKLYSNYIYYTNNLILVLEKESSMNSSNKLEKNVTVDRNDSNKLTSKVTTAMFKIHNVLETNNTDAQLLSISNYVNNILSNLINEFPELNKAFTDNALEVTNTGDKTLLIVDDDAITRKLLEKIFVDEYKIITATNGKDAIDILENIRKKDAFETKEDIVAVFLDLVMPVVDGFGVLDYLNDKNYFNKLPVAIISGDYSKETRVRVYSYPIADMLEKPFNAEIIKHRINNLVNLYKSSKYLNDLLRNQNTDMHNIIDNVLKTYELDNQSNINKVKQITGVLARQVSNDYPVYNLNQNKINTLIETSVYYNLGSYLLPKTISSKIDNFTEGEKTIINNYNIMGYNLIKYSSTLDKSDLFNAYCQEIIMNINENFDGTGYPNGLKDIKLPIETQIVSLAKQCLTTTDYNSIISLANKKYHPNLIDSFKKIVTSSSNTN